jgi:hypothetical protein
MTQEDGIFSQETQPAEEPKIDESKDWEQELVGENKKFKSTKDLAKGKAEADAYIDHLKRELSELRSDLNQRLRLEELMTKLTESAQARPAVEAESSQAPAREEGNREALTPEKVEQILEQRERQRQAQHNLEESKKILRAAFGDKASNELLRRTEELGLSRDFVDNVARTSPTAFKKLIGLTDAPQGTQETVFTPPRNQVNSGALPSSNNAGVKTFAQYETLRRENPRKYFTPEVQNEMFRAAKELGEKFYS